MTPSSAGLTGAGLIGGVDIDAVAAAVASCPGVSALDGGRFGEVASYLPGRVVQGVAVDNGRVQVQVRSQWGVPVPDLAGRITARLAPLAGSLPVDVMVADIDDPPGPPLVPVAGVAAGSGPSRPPVPGLPPADLGSPSVPQPGSE